MYGADGRRFGAGHRGGRPGVRRPARAGAAMAVGADGEVVGSVSGGCVEGAVYELAEEVESAGGQPGACDPATGSATTTPSRSG